jgi:hypothetical protein
MMVDIREYHDRGGHSPFREWYDRLNAEAARKVTTALYRVGLGNFSNAKSVGAGVYELQNQFWPRLSSVFWERRRTDSHPSWRWNETAPTERHQACSGTMGRLQAQEEATERKEGE